MAFQSVVNQNLGFGVQGEILFDGPIRSESLIVNSSGAGNTIGYAYTKDATTNVAQVGGTIGANRVFAGILAMPKTYASYGTTAGPLAPTLNIPDNFQGEFVTMGFIIVSSATACVIGDLVVYDQTTGALSTVAAGTTNPGAGKGFVPGATIWRYPLSGAGLTAIRITN